MTFGKGKKRNPDPEPKQQGLMKTGELVDPQSERQQLPPIRSFILTQYDAQTGEKTQRTIYAHGFDFGEDRVIAFITFFFLPNGKMVSTPRYTFNGDAWEEIEEVRADFIDQTQ